jgi:uncharacterized protein (TIGR02147 family)
MPVIFNYLDYREFLKDFYEEQKAEKPSFSYQWWADKAGFKSKSFIKLVIDGRKNLTDESLEKLNLVLKLAEKPFSYFKDLVAYNQVSTHALKKFYFERLFRYRKRSPGRLILQNQYDFYSKWYTNTIREIVTFFDFKGDFEALAKKIQPPISARQAKESVRLLLKLGLIKKTKNGYVQTDPLVTTGDEVKSLAVQNFHLQNMVLAAESIDTCPSQERDISCLVLGLSKQGFEAVKEETQNYRKRLLQIASDDRNIDRVYHVAIELFPTSRKGESI